MKTITVYVQVSVAAAVGAGTTTYGEAGLELSPAGLASLSEAARAVVAGLDRDGKVRGRPLAVGVVSEAALLAALEAEAASRAAEARAAAAQIERDVQAQLAWPIDTWILSLTGGPQVRQVGSAADPRVLARREEIVRDHLPLARAAWMDAQHAEAIAYDRRRTEDAHRADEASRVATALVAEHGTPSQRERHAAGVLPRAELIELAEGAWLPEIGLEPDVETDGHELEADSTCTHERARYATDAVQGAGTWTAPEWDAIQLVRRAVRDVPGSEVELRLVRVSCRDCDVTARYRQARVTVERAGIAVAQCYLLRPAEVQS